MFRELEQFLNVFANPGISGFEVLVQRGESELNSEVRLDHAVVNVVGDSTSLGLGGVRREVVDQPDVLHHRRDVVHQLQHEVHVRTIELHRTIHDVKTAHCLMTIVNRN